MSNLIKIDITPLKNDQFLSFVCKQERVLVKKRINIHIHVLYITHSKIENSNKRWHVKAIHK